MDFLQALCNVAILGGHDSTLPTQSGMWRPEAVVPHRLDL